MDSFVAFGSKILVQPPNLCLQILTVKNTQQISNGERFYEISSKRKMAPLVSVLCLLHSPDESLRETKALCWQGFAQLGAQLLLGSIPAANHENTEHENIEALKFGVISK